MLVIMLRKPTSFLIAGNCGTGLRNLTYETCRASGRESLMAANENWTAMSTREPSLDRGKRNKGHEIAHSGFQDSPMIKAVHESVNSHGDV